MSSSTAQEYIELFGDDRQGRLALLACCAALRLDDETAHAAIEMVARSNGSTERLLRRVKNLGCVWTEWDDSWYVVEDVRPHLLDQLYVEVPEATVSSLRERLAANADARAELLPSNGQVTNHDRLLSRFEAAYQRILIPEKSDEGAAQLAQLWQRLWSSSPDEASATARSVDYLADEIDRRLRRLPDEVLFLRGMAARSRGDVKKQEEYFRRVWERGRHGYIYAVGAHLFGQIVKGRDPKTAERAMRDSFEWHAAPFHRKQVLHSLGVLLAKNPDRYPEAERVLRQSLKLSEDDFSRAQRLHSLGNLLAKDPAHWQKGNEAERVLMQSLELARDDHSRAQRLHSIGKLLFKMVGRRDEAEAALTKSLRLLSAPHDKAWVLGTWASALAELNDPESDSKAEEHALHGVELASGDWKRRENLYRLLVLIYERRGNYQKTIELCKVWKEDGQKLGKRKSVQEAQNKINELRRRVVGRRGSKRKWWEE